MRAGSRETSFSRCEPSAFANHRRADTPPGSSPFPAQIRWKPLFECAPAGEAAWAHIPTRAMRRGRGGAGHAIYELWLSAEQANALAAVLIMLMGGAPAAANRQALSAAAATGARGESEA